MVRFANSSIYAEYIYEKIMTIFVSYAILAMRRYIHSFYPTGGDSYFII